MRLAIRHPQLAAGPHACGRVQRRDDPHGDALRLEELLDLEFADSLRSERALFGLTAPVPLNEEVPALRLEGVERLADEGIAVLYTTHYMEEAERLCDRVGIVDLGELKAEGTRQELVSLVGQHDQVQLAATGDLSAGARVIAEIGAVREASVRDGGIDLIVDEARNVLPEILARTAAAGVSVRSVEVKEPDLEAVFLHLTGKALRD